MDPERSKGFNPLEFLVRIGIFLIALFLLYKTLQHFHVHMFGYHF